MHCNTSARDIMHKCCFDNNASWSGVLTSLYHSLYVLVLLSMPYYYLNNDSNLSTSFLCLGFLDPSDIADFRKECLKMKAFVHPHVMGILGICLDGQAPYVVMPFMANGSLHTYLRKHRIELLISEAADIDLV